MAAAAAYICMRSTGPAHKFDYVYTPIPGLETSSYLFQIPIAGRDGHTGRGDLADRTNK